MEEKPDFKEIKIKDVNRVSKRVKTRSIWIPNEAMREIHQDVLTYLKKEDISLPSAAGCLPGNSPLKNLKRHTRYNEGVGYYPRHWYLTDLSNAYKHVHPVLLSEALYPYFKTSMELNDLERFISTYCIKKDEGLITGASLSPLFFNIYCEMQIDKNIREYCTKHSITYSRYLDDLIFSSDKIIGKKIRKKILSIVRKGGFQVNVSKTHLGDLQKKALEINGIGLRQENDSYILFMPRHYLKHIRGLLNLVLKEKIELNSSVIHGKMGLFISFTKNRNLTKSEQNVLKLYQEFKRKIKEKRPKNN